MKKEPVVLSQVVPLAIAFISAGVFLSLLFLNILLSNHLFPHNAIQLTVRIVDLLLGFYLYLKTSIDFAVFIGAMMVANPGWKNRVAVEWGTSFGNFIGTILIVWVWTIFRQTSPLLEGIIVVLASFVLLELAAGSLSRLKTAGWPEEKSWHRLFYATSHALLAIRRFTSPFLGWMPDVEGAMAGKKAPNFTALLLYSFTVPFVLGSDDFASYISVFSIVNVFSFAIGVILGHMLLLAGIFAAPQKVEDLMAKPEFSALAVVTFFIIFIIGVTDGAKILLLWGRSNLIPLFCLIILAILISTQHHRITHGWEKTRERALKLIRKS